METLQRTANAGSVSTGYDVENSCKLEADNTEYFTRDVASAGNRDIGTISMWIKRTELGTAQYLFTFGNTDSDTGATFAYFNADNSLSIAGGSTVWRTTSRVFRDPAAWMHIAIAFDTTDGTANDMFKLYINGVRETSFSTTNNPSQNDDLGLNFQKQVIGYNSVDSASPFCGYIAEVVIQDGVASAPTEFGETDSASGIWKPSDPSGVTFGTNGAYMDFKASGNLGNDVNGGTDFTETNIAAADQATDTPTNNFCTLNPIAYNISHTHTLSEGNTKYFKNSADYGMMYGTHYVGAGKWYWEIKATDLILHYNMVFGIVDAHKPKINGDTFGYKGGSAYDADNPEVLMFGGSPNNWFMNSDSTMNNNGTTGSVDYTSADGDILAFALDMENGGYWMGNSRWEGVGNGSFWCAPGGTTTSGSVATTDPTNGNYALIGNGGGTNSGTPNFNGEPINGGSLLTAGFTLVTPHMGQYGDSTDCTFEMNFGGYNSYAEDGGYADANGYGNFAYAVPSGFYAICSKNMAEFGGSG
jgi:hypothetical protein